MSLTLTAANFLGGIGLFLAGIWLMTDGLKLAAGSALRDILGFWTNSRGRGLLAGFALTALVQSSSAVTVATIGFANAGLLTLEQAIWVIFGTNVGTTMTGWIVALIGFKLDVSAFALPLVGVGMILRLSGPDTRRGAVGQAVLGFGLLFLGIDGLKDAFGAVGESFTLPSVIGEDLRVAVVYVLIGFLLTTLMQSSSAALVVTLTAAEGGVIGLYAAAAAVIGANLGTTTTAVLAVWGATPTAKRVAASHVVFNLVTAAFAIVVLVPLLGLVGMTQAFLDLPPAPATSLALFHTVFNILGVALMWPLSARLVPRIAGWFHTAGEDAGRPQYLDGNALSVPDVAANAMVAELRRLIGLAQTALADILATRAAAHSGGNGMHAAIRQVAAAVANFSARLSRTPLSEQVAAGLPNLLRVAQHCVTAADLMHAAGVRELLTKAFARQPLNDTRDAFVDSCRNALEALRGATATPDDAQMSGVLASCEHHYETLKMALLKAGARGDLAALEMDVALRGAQDLHRAVTHLERGARRLRSAASELAGSASESTQSDAFEPGDS